MVKLREEMISKLEEADRLMRQSGTCASWFHGAGHEIRSVAGKSNGRLLKTLLEASNYEDAEAADLLRVGASMIGSLSPSGVGAPMESASPKSPEELRQTCRLHNRALLEQLREHEHSSWLLEATRDYAGKGRMSWPVPLERIDLERVLLHPRFVVCRVRADTFPAEKFSHDSRFAWGGHVLFCESHRRLAWLIQGRR